jgi:excinuclease ABC subunit B
LFGSFAGHERVGNGLTISELESEMLKAAEDLQFEKAALLRDQIKELKRMMDGEKAEETATEARGRYRRQKRARRA